MSDKETVQTRRHGRSLFGPIIMITVGVFFLLSNLGILPTLNWVGILQLWPLILIFIGVNLLARHAPGNLGTLLSGLVSLTAVLVFGYILLAGEDNALLNRFGLANNLEIKREDVSFPAAGLQEATINIDLDAVDSHLYALNDSANLIEGTVSYTGDLIFDTNTFGERAEVTLDTRDNRFPFMGVSGLGFSEEDDWQLGLNPNVITDLTIDAGSGRLMLDLAGLSLSELKIDNGSGRSDLFLPGGEFDVEVDSGSGATEITLAGNGRYHLNVDSGSGSLTIYLPPTTAARLDFDGGSGRLHVDERFQQISGDDNDGVWETAAFDTADSFADMTIDAGSGSVWVKPVVGR